MGSHQTRHAPCAGSRSSTARKPSRDMACRRHRAWIMPTEASVGAKIAAAALVLFHHVIATVVTHSHDPLRGKASVWPSTCRVIHKGAPGTLFHRLIRHSC